MNSPKKELDKKEDFPSMGGVLNSYIDQILVAPTVMG